METALEKKVWFEECVTQFKTIEEDTVVPEAELPALIRGVKAYGKQNNIHAVCYGQAGDGNLYSLNNHVSFLP